MADIFKGRRFRKAARKATEGKTLKKRIGARKAKRGIGLGKTKAKLILKDKVVRGKPITRRQRGLFGLIAGGRKPTRLAKRGGQLSALKRKALKRKKK